MATDESKANPSVQQYCQRILDLLADGVYISDRDGNTLAVNDMYERLTGLKKADLVGRHVEELVRRGFDTVLNPQIVKTGKPAASVQTDDRGNKRVLNGYPLLDAEGRVELVVTFVRDVTLITQLTEQLAAQRRLIEHYRTSVRYANEERRKKYPIISSSPVMAALMVRLENVAATDATVLLQGETGVGKDILARRIHQTSPRHDRAFFKVDCPSIPESLIESELFGYAPGAFSGASTKGKVGFFELADKGTLFLDEIGELPLSLQTKLLRVLQDSEIMRLGATRVRPVDVRIVAATHRDLEQDVRSGRFRSDLFYRLRVAVLHIPPLRERREDIFPLARHFLERNNARYKKTVRLSPETEQIWLAHPWPGNVRELENLIQGLVIGNDTGIIRPCDLPGSMAGQSAHLRHEEAPGVPAGMVPSGRNGPDVGVNLYQMLGKGGRSLKEIITDVECAILKEAIQTHGSIGETARRLKVDRSTLFRKLRCARPGKTTPSAAPSSPSK
jgi:PAS domain S-box-containing protein